VGVCNQITFLPLYYIISQLVTLLKFIDAPIQTPSIFYLTVSFKFLNCSFKICLLFVYEVSAGIAQNIYTAFACILYLLRFSLLPLI